MFKRGQVTLFIIVGIVVVIAIALVIGLRSALFQGAGEQAVARTLAFPDAVHEVAGIVDGCLEAGLKKGVVQLGGKKVDDYESELAEVVQGELYRCVDFSQVKGVDVTRRTPSVQISLSEDRTKVIADADFELVVKRGDDVERLKDFSKELDLFTECCIPVKVDSQCRAKESGEFRVCVSQYTIEEGNSLMSGGECLAC